MDSVLHTRVTRHAQRHNRILVDLRYLLVNNDRVNVRLHVDGVVPWLEEDVGEESVADGGGVDGEVHGDVAEVEGHDGGVGDEGFGEHVGAVGEFVGAGEDFGDGDVEAFELVQTCWWNG